MSDAYTYDPVTKEDLFQAECQIDPIDGGHLLPANSTHSVPPVKEEGKAIVWEDDQWVQKNDYRNSGVKVFNGTSMVNRDFIGDLPDGWSWEPPSA